MDKDKLGSDDKNEDGGNIKEALKSLNENQAAEKEDHTRNSKKWKLFATQLSLWCIRDLVELLVLD